MEMCSGCQIWHRRGGWITKRVRATHGCSLWKNIMMGWDDFLKHISFDVGLGNRVLERHLPDQEATIDTMFVCQTNGRNREWIISLCRDFNDWELESVVSFFNLIHSNAPTKEDSDWLTWRLNRQGIYDTRSYYHALQAHTGEPFPWKSIWG